MNGSVMRQQDSARSGFVTTSSEEATLDLVTTRVPQRGDTVSDCDTCHLRTTPKKAVELCVQGRAVTTPVEQSACCWETELAPFLVSSLTFRQTV